MTDGITASSKKLDHWGDDGLWYEGQPIVKDHPALGDSDDRFLNCEIIRAFPGFPSTSRSALPKSSLGPKMIASNLLTGSVFRTEGKPISSWELLLARTENRRPFRK
jgi:hypothetical protein